MDMNKKSQHWKGIKIGLMGSYLVLVILVTVTDITIDSLFVVLAIMMVGWYMAWGRQKECEIDEQKEEAQRRLERQQNKKIL